MVNLVELQKPVVRKRVNFNGNTIALIVRGKKSEQHSPGLMAQHADVVLPSGEIIGFFGENAGNSGEGSGFNLKGVVYDTSPDGLMKKRPYYVDINLAKKMNVVSTVLILNITSEQAVKFSAYWDKLTKNAGEFNIVGENCSTRAASGFQGAGLIASEIPSLDTPDNLYRLLRHKFKVTSKTISGYVGLEMLPIKPPLAPRFNLIIEEIN
jgi:hypothetical protein